MTFYGLTAGMYTIYVTDRYRVYTAYAHNRAYYMVIYLFFCHHTYTYLLLFTYIYIGRFGTLIATKACVLYELSKERYTHMLEEDPALALVLSEICMVRHA